MTMTIRMGLAILLALVCANVGAAQDMPLSQIVVEGEGWKEVAHGQSAIRWLVADENGKVTFVFGNAARIIRPSDGEVISKELATEWKGSDGFVPGVTTKSGKAYRIDDRKLVGKIDKGEVNIALPERLSSPTGLVLWPDDGTLVVGDAKGKYLWAFRVEKDGSLTAGEPYYPLRMKPGEKESHVTALTIDDKRRVYACTPLGIQVFDPTGRLSGVLNKPGDGELTGIAFGGVDGDRLFVACGDKVFARKMQGKSVLMAKSKE
jgi:gluconolactonase